MFWKCVGHVIGMFRAYLGHVSAMCRVCFGFVLGMFGHVLGIFPAYLHIFILSWFMQLEERQQHTLNMIWNACQHLFGIAFLSISADAENLVFDQHYDTLAGFTLPETQHFDIICQCLSIFLAFSLFYVDFLQKYDFGTPLRSCGARAAFMNRVLPQMPPETYKDSIPHTFSLLLVPSRQNCPCFSVELSHHPWVSVCI